MSWSAMRSASGIRAEDSISRMSSALLMARPANHSRSEVPAGAGGGEAKTRSRVMIAWSSTVGLLVIVSLYHGMQPRFHCHGP